MGTGVQVAAGTIAGGIGATAGGKEGTSVGGITIAIGVGGSSEKNRLLISS